MILQKLKYGSVYASVELSVEAEFHFLSLKKTKKELNVIQSETYNQFNDLISGTKGTKHLFLVINHKQVLSKKVHLLGSSKETIIKSAFPNIIQNEFYTQVLDFETFSIASICRKNVVEDLVSEFASRGISVIGFSLGNSGVKKLLPFLHSTDLQTSNEIFQVKEGKVLNWQKRQDTFKDYDINGLQIASPFLLSLAGILTYCNGLSSSEYEITSGRLIKEFYQKRIFQLGLQCGLGFILISLLVNVMLFSSYGNKVADLNDQLVLNKTLNEQIKKLDRLVLEKKRLVEGMNAASSSKVLWYFDQIAKSVPNTILLDNIGYQPILGAIRKEKEVLTINNQITISGFTKDESDLTIWTAQLEKIKWVEKVSIKDIESKNAKVTIFDFVLYLKSDAL